MDFVIALLGAGVGSGMMAIVLAWFERKWNREDEREAKTAIDPQKLDALIAAQKVLMVDRVRYLGQGYILAREITLEAKETLSEMHSAYKALGGNGRLDTIMDELEKLKVVNGLEKRKGE